jgi:hypothetical protein
MRSGFVRPLGNGWWEAEANFAAGQQFDSTTDPTSGPPASGSEPGGGETTADEIVPVDVKGRGGARQQHVTSGLRRISASKKQGDNREIPNHHGLIGVDKTHVAGVDIAVPESSWTESWKWNLSLVKYEYIDRIEMLIGRVNHRKFRNKAAGEVMFMGFDHHAEGKEFRVFTYEFKFEPNTSFRISDERDAGGQLIWPVLIEKEGFQYVWCEYEPVVGAAAESLPMRPRAVYVDEVGRPGNWIVEATGQLYKPRRGENPPAGSVPTNKDTFDDLRIGR